MSLLTNIPSEIFREIVENLDLVDILQLATTNPQIQRLVSDENLWRQLTQRDFPKQPLIGRSWFNTYQYYNRKVWVVHELYNHYVYKTTICGFQQKAIDYVWENHFEDSVMYKTLVPNMQMSDLMIDIDQNLGAGDYMQKLLQTGDAKAAFETNRVGEEFPELLAMSSSEVTALFLEYLDLREQYRKAIYRGFKEKGMLGYESYTFVIKQQPIL